MIYVIIISVETIIYLFAHRHNLQKRILKMLTFGAKLIILFLVHSHDIYYAILGHTK